MHIFFFTNNVAIQWTGVTSHTVELCLILAFFSFVQYSVFLKESTKVVSKANIK